MSRFFAGGDSESSSSSSSESEQEETNVRAVVSKFGTAYESSSGKLVIFSFIDLYSIATYINIYIFIFISIYIKLYYLYIYIFRI